MVHIDITPKAGKIYLIGRYTWEDEEATEEFHLELKWTTSEGAGLKINQILWKMDIDELKKSIAEVEIQNAYENLSKEIVVLFKDK